MTILVAPRRKAHRTAFDAVERVSDPPIVIVSQDAPGKRAVTCNLPPGWTLPPALRRDLERGARQIGGPAVEAAAVDSSVLVQRVPIAKARQVAVFVETVCRIAEPSAPAVP